MSNWRIKNGCSYQEWRVTTTDDGNVYSDDNLYALDKNGFSARVRTWGSVEIAYRATSQETSREGVTMIEFSCVTGVVVGMLILSIGAGLGWIARVYVERQNQQWADWDD